MRRRTYNPAQLSAEELKSSFVARGESLDELLALLREQAPGRPCQHVLLVGPRGMGKTTLGLRFLQAVREAPDLAAAWQPVPFDEESYEVTDLGEFWLTALRHLSRATGEERWVNRADELARAERDPARRESYALASLLDFCEGHGQRIILFVENLDLIFAQIGDEREIHALRAALIGHPELLLVGSANAVFDALRDQDAPFYEFFLHIKLSGLGPDACRAVFARFLEPDSSRSVADALATERGRIETIRTLTGGNPRLLTLAAEILMDSPLGSAFEDLERLIDEQTPYFKAMIEALPVQARKVFHFLAGEWTPQRARDIAAGVNLAVSHTSSQLRQLAAKGYVREARVEGEARARYEVADRFYNMYYLLRFSRPGRERLDRFVSFLRELYGEGGMRVLYATTLRSMQDQTLPETELADWIGVFARHVAGDPHYGEQDAWFEGAIRTSVESLGAQAPVLDELDQRAPEAAAEVYLDISRQLVDAERFEDAEAILLRVAERASNSRCETLLLVGLVRQFSGKSDAALATFEKVVASAPRTEEFGRMVIVSALMLIAELRLQRHEHDAVLRAAHEACDLERETNNDVLRSMVARQLGSLGEGLCDAGLREEGVGLWLRVRQFVASASDAKLRLHTARALCAAGGALTTAGEHERSCRALHEVDALVAAQDGPELREVRIRALGLEGTSQWQLAQYTDAIGTWKRAYEYVLAEDNVEIRELAAACLSMVSVGMVKQRLNDEALSDACEWSKVAVGLAPRNAMALSALARALAFSGTWEESIKVIGRALAHLEESQELVEAQPMLLLIAATGHAQQVYDFMAGTRLENDLEVLWHALELELGKPARALPAEIRDAVAHVRRILNRTDPPPKAAR